MLPDVDTARDIDEQDNTNTDGHADHDPKVGAACHEAGLGHEDTCRQGTEYDKYPSPIKQLSHASTPS